MRQVHGDTVRAAAAPPGGWDRPQCDALVATAPGVGVAVKAADCVPVLLSDPVSGAVAGAHAGWRGTVRGIAAKAALALARETGAPPSRLRAVIGPAIRSCCFEVGPEVIAAFAAAGHDPARITRDPGRPGARPHLDLALANRDQLVEAGLPPPGVFDAALCTRCHPAFHSYRRDGASVGRNWAFTITAGAPDHAGKDAAPPTAETR